MKTSSEVLDIPAKVKDGTVVKSILDQNMILGYGLLLVSIGLFWTGEFSIESGEGKTFTLFVAHYVLAIVYAIYLLSVGMYGIRKSWKKENISVTVILLNLFLVSAFALNREMTVFEKSVEWLCVYITVASVTLLSFHYYKFIPVWINKFQHFFLGSGIVLFIYQALFVAKMYGVGTVGIIFFGIGAHAFVPITLIVASLSIIKYYNGRLQYRWLVAGLAITVLFASAFVKEWSKRASEIERLSNQSVLKPDSQLPAWIRVGQWIPVDWITHKLLRSDLVYTTSKPDGGSWFEMPRRSSWAEARKHDPLVFISSHFSKSNLPEEDRIKIIQAISGSRHDAQERLWEGDNLLTSYIVSDIELFPDLRIAYTEKYLNVSNANYRRWWGNSQEAIYTFQLPEGSVVTSLSLWIDGKEEKGILTSKQKAQQAYETIVGREARDPSMIHWQEGNTVSVRVFPCTPDEERKFKIGITSPLVEEDGKILYKNITFQGPNATNAHETIRLSLAGSSNGVEMPSGFSRDETGDFIHEGTYNEEMRFEVESTPLKSDNRFVFLGSQYTLTEYEPTYVPFVATDIYLDLNNSWLHREIEFFRSVKNQRNVFISTDNGFVRLTDENWDLIDNIKNNNFSVFPFHQINDTANALVVTKGKRLSPYLQDIKESSFGTALRDFFSSANKVHVYNLGNDVPMYIRSLREFRAFEFGSGTLEGIASLLTSNKFPQVAEDDNTVVLHDSQMKISRSNAVVEQSNAPDHLARLFAYNNIMRKVGSTYFTKDYINDELVTEASMAYVVSPVSSLVVLESAEDYERFDIKDNNLSLHNAARRHSGAVPEPHEWALIGLFGLFVVFVIVRKAKFFPIL
ncbi:MAG TPA: XrtN system VIT domain-containing protein [Chryseolinea sp.]|nr:XrtN system VIT domain-containing protein [Chryseolinea sp.]